MSNMGFTISQSKDAVQAARRFQVRAELNNLELLDCSAFRSEAAAELQKPLRLGLNLEPSVLEVSENEARFAVHITVYGDHADGPDENPHLFQVASRYALAYRLRPGYTPSQEELDAFKEGNAIFHCWPYTRELVQSLTMRMGLPIPPMPFLRLAPKDGPKKTAAKRQTKRSKSANTSQSGLR